MSEKEKQYLPQSSAGLLRYGETDSKIKIKPVHVVVVSLAFAGVVILLKFFG